MARFLVTERTHSFRTLSHAVDIEQRESPEEIVFPCNFLLQLVSSVALPGRRTSSSCCPYLSSSQTGPGVVQDVSVENGGMGTQEQIAFQQQLAAMTPAQLQQQMMYLQQQMAAMGDLEGYPLAQEGVAGYGYAPAQPEPVFGAPQQAPAPPPGSFAFG